MPSDVADNYSKSTTMSQPGLGNSFLDAENKSKLVMVVFNCLQSLKSKKIILHQIKLAVHGWSTKYRLNQKLIIQFGSNLRDERFEPN